MRIEPTPTDATPLPAKRMTKEDYVKYYEEKLAALIAANASKSEINWMMQRLARWRGSR